MSENQQMKQVWFTDEDEHKFELIAQDLQAQGVDVKPENGDATTPYSYTKVIRHLISEAAEILEDSEDEEEYTKEQILADLREALHDAITGNTLPASALWEDIDDE